MQDKIADLEAMILQPEKTRAGCSFADIPIPISFDLSNLVVLGVPVDVTTTFGKTASGGPEAIRITSAKQIETMVFEKNIEIFESGLIYDLGDLKIDNPSLGRNFGIDKVKEFWDNFDFQISKIFKILSDTRKIPIVLGGEHTITYSLLKNIRKNNPIILHFDAHRDMKSIYDGMEMCHTTPFYHLINSGIIEGKDLIQIGIRQADKDENDFAIKNDVITFDAWKCNSSLDDIKKWINQNTVNREIYVSFDIDVYDICYLPCTGTPEPFGLNPFQISDIISSINSTSKLIGIDMVETGLKNNDYREGTLGTQTLLRFLTADFVSV